jgi:hypothetical protein
MHWGQLHGCTLSFYGSSAPAYCEDNVWNGIDHPTMFCPLEESPNLNRYVSVSGRGDQERRWREPSKVSFSSSAMSLVHSISGVLGILKVWLTMAPRWWEFPFLLRLFLLSFWMMLHPYTSSYSRSGRISYSLVWFYVGLFQSTIVIISDGCC